MPSKGKKRMSLASGSRVFEADYPAEPQVVHQVRERVEEFVRPSGINADELDALKVALSEAFSNAVCHGSPLGPRNRVHLRCESDGQRLIIQITDEGGGFLPSRISLPDLEEWKTSGRGLFIMQELMDAVEFELVPGGTRVRLLKLLPLLHPERAEAKGPAKPRADKLTFAAVSG
jgi:serine/threonine-protein kinase RsbW